MDYQNSFDNFLSGRSIDAKIKVWCKLVKFSRRSSKKFLICHDFANGKLLQKWAFPTPNNSAKFREYIDMRINNVQHIKWEL